MSSRSPDALTEFQWTPQPAAETFVKATSPTCWAKNAFAATFANRLYAEAGVRFNDCIGHICLKDTDNTRLQQAVDAGWKLVRTETNGTPVFVHPGGLFPTVVVHKHFEVALKVESVPDFLAANGLRRNIEGAPLADVRVATISDENDAGFLVIERHGNASFTQPCDAPRYAIKRLEHQEALRTRPRDVSDDEGFAVASRLIDASIRDLGVDLTCDLFFAAEREYWQRRNKAAQIQYARQARLGIGWANHDHHTYRSSRAGFKPLVEVWEKLGLVCRERFYAGIEAGWGAQVMEQPVCGIITFNDVDLSPEELMGDFSHDGLASRDKLGTIGLWCGLHGEAFLQAGMHHLECMFDFDALRDQLDEQGIKTMKPFTNFPYLRQAFTEGERWAVDAKRADVLLAKHLITLEQAESFKANGALGSHLENLERNDGFKGFNQKGVSEIINATDPRKQKPGATVEYQTAH